MSKTKEQIEKEALEALKEKGLGVHTSRPTKPIITEDSLFQEHDTVNEK